MVYTLNMNELFWRKTPKNRTTGLLHIYAKIVTHIITKNPSSHARCYETCHTSKRVANSLSKRKLANYHNFALLTLNMSTIS